MSPTMGTARLRLAPVESKDEERLCALLWHSDVRRYLCDDALIPRERVRATIQASRNPSSMTAFWALLTLEGEFVGFVGLEPPTATTLRLRAIGWRSLEVWIALGPRFWGKGYAAEALDAVAGFAGADGVTFALIGCVDLPNERSHNLMCRLGFHELGRVPGPAHELVVYERAV